MTKYTPEEMLAINAIAGYEEIFGLPFNIENQNMESVNKQVKLSLIEKGILSEQGITDVGMMIALSFEEYQKANIHIFLNRSRMALHGDSVISFTKETCDIQMIRKHKVNVIKDIVMAHPFLRQAQKKRFLVAQPILCKEIEWKNNEINNFSNVIVIQKYKNKKLASYQCIAWNEEKGCCFDYLGEMKQEMGARDIRMRLLELFEVKGEMIDGDEI